jgi:cell division septal protein FtsQ
MRDAIRESTIGKSQLMMMDSTMLRLDGVLLLLLLLLLMLLLGGMVLFFICVYVPMVD